MQIRFERLTEQDLPRMHRWLNTPLLIDIWNNGKRISFDGVVAKFLPRIKGEVPDDPYLILGDQAPIGYINTYLWSSYPEYLPFLATDEEAASLDFFIGEEAFRGRGIGSVVLRQFLREILFTRAATASCITTPEVRNQTGLRTYEKAGFKRWRVVEPPFEPGPICLMRITRDEV